MLTPAGCGRPHVGRAPGGDRASLAFTPQLRAAFTARIKRGGLSPA